MKRILMITFACMLLLCFPIEIESMIYACPNEWTLMERVVPRCYQTLTPLFRSDLSTRCKTTGGTALNIDSYDIAVEVIEIMRRNSVYGVWLDAKKNEDGYSWIDGRSAPKPLTWCDDIKQKEDNLVLVCPYPNYDNFSTSTCCISDRQGLTEWAGICKTFVLRSCLYKPGKQLRPDPDLFKYLGSQTVNEITGAMPESECCKHCTVTQYCTAFNYLRDKKLCEFYQALKVTSNFNSQATQAGTRNIIAGTFVELA